MTAPHKRFEFHEILEFIREAKDAFARTVMILMAMTALVAGAVEFLHTKVDVAGEHARLDAQELGALAMAELVRDDQMAQTEYEKFALAQEERTRRFNAAQWRIWQLLNSSSETTVAVDWEMTRLDQLIKRAEELSDIKGGGPYGPEQDQGFPNQFFARELKGYWQLWAKQDAANEEYQAWKRQQRQHTTVLTLFAAALYLFGLSLAIQLPVREFLAGVAVLLVMVGITWAGWTTAHTPRHMSKEDAKAYAEAYADGQESFSAGQYARARDLFTRAIEKRKTFAQAYLDRGRASFQIGSPQRMGLPGATDLKALAAAVADDQRAIELGLRSASALLESGFDLFLLAVDGEPSKSRARLRRSIAATQQAVDLRADDTPILFYNLGAAYLASQQFEKAHRSYSDAVKATLAKNGQSFRYSRWRQERYVAGALTDLESVLRARTKLAASEKARDALACEVRTLKEYLVGSVSMKRALPVRGDCSAATDTSMSFFDIFPASLRWQAKLGDYEAKRDVLSVQWYYGFQDRNQQKWVVLSDVSSLETRVHRNPFRPGFSYGQQTYLDRASPPSCVQSGQYRAELYVNGRLVNPMSKGSPTTFAEMKAILSRDLNGEFCIPQGKIPQEDWQPWSENSVPGFVAGYRSSDPGHTRGLLLVRFHHPQPPTGTPKAAQEMVVNRYRTIVLERLLHLTPGEYGPAQVPDGFLGLQWAKQLSGYRAGNIAIVEEAGLLPNGAVIIYLIYGPAGYIQGEEAPDIFNSLQILVTWMECSEGKAWNACGSSTQ